MSLAHLRILLLMLFCTGLLSAQDSLYVLHGRVVDAATKRPLANVSIRLRESLRGTSTDSSGRFRIELPKSGADLQFSLVGYQSKTKSITSAPNTEAVIELVEEVQSLAEVNINADKVQQVIKSNASNVLDYSFEQGNILLITYSGTLKKSRLILLSPGLDTLYKLMLPEEPASLFKDCLGNNHVVCEKHTYQVYNNAEGLKLMPPENISSFEKILFPCAAADSSHLYFFKKSGAQPYDVGFRATYTMNDRIQYTSVNRYNKKSSVLCVIEDQEVRRKRAEELYNEKIKEAAGMYLHFTKEGDRLFFESIELKEIYAPLFTGRDKLYVFDHVNSGLCTYTKNGDSLGTVAISYHKEQGWKREIFMDPVSGRAFALFQDKGINTLKEIDLLTGKVLKMYIIPLTFAYDLKVFDNKVYFLYRNDFYYPTKSLARLALD